MVRFVTILLAAFTATIGMASRNPVENIVEPISSICTAAPRVSTNDPAG